MATRVMHFICLKPSKRGSFEDFVCFLNKEALSRGLQITFFFEDGICPEVENQFRLFNVQYHLIPMNTRFYYYIALLRALIRCKPDVVHFHFSHFTVLSILLCKLFGVRELFQTKHDSASYEASNVFIIELVKNLRRRLIFTGVNKFIAVSKYVEKQLVTKMHIPRRKVENIYNGVDVGRFHPLKNKTELKMQLVGTRDCKLVMYIGQLIHEKGVHVLVEALSEVMKKDKTVFAAVAGAGDMKEQLMAQVEHLNLADRIRFLGVRNDTEELLNAADLAVCPSIWEEAFGLVNIEAMACGVPIIASRVGGIPEIVRHLETGFLVDPGHPRMLSTAIERVLADETLQSELRQKGLRVARADFTIERMASEYVDMYVMPGQASGHTTKGTE